MSVQLMSFHCLQYPMCSSLASMHILYPSRQHRKDIGYAVYLYIYKYYNNSKLKVMFYYIGLRVYRKATLN